MAEDLAEWLRIQLDKDATEIADPYAEKSWHTRDCDSIPDADYPTYACNCGAPERALAEIEAKRALVDEYTQAEESLARWTCPDMVDVGRADGLRAGVAHAALPYVARPGYSEDWRP